MTDDLRTRIAAAACDATSAGKLFPWETLSEAQRDAWLTVADAVIRELQLTQQYLVDGIISDGEPRPWEVPCETRYATEWERFNA